MYSIEDVELQKWTVSGLDARVAVLGQGPVALCVHGWPECWYSWRHQMVLLANAGYRVIAPDMPGFGQTQGYAEIADYTIERTGRFLSDLIAEAGVSNVLLLGHDWGAINVWGFALQYPHKVSKMVVMSVPLKPLGEQPPTEQLRELFQDRFFYQLYFQQPGVAEAEFDADPEGILRALFCSPDTPRAKPVLGKSISEGGGWIGRLGKPLEQPGWLTDEAIAYYVKNLSAERLRRRAPLLPKHRPELADHAAVRRCAYRLPGVVFIRRNGLRDPARYGRAFGRANDRSCAQPDGPGFARQGTLATR